MNDLAKPNWIDLSANGLRLYMLHINATKRYFVAMGACADNDPALGALGFRAHPRNGYYVRAHDAKHPLPIGAILKAFPHSRLVHLDPASFVLQVKAPSVDTDGAPLPVAPLGADRQPSQEGALLARLIDGWQQTERARRGEPFHGRIVIEGMPRIVAQGAPDDARYAVTVALEADAPGGGGARRFGWVRCALDSAGRWVLQETAIDAGPDGPIVGNDPSVARLFLRNLLHRAAHRHFVEAAPSDTEAAAPTESDPLPVHGRWAQPLHARTPDGAERAVTLTRTRQFRDNVYVDVTFAEPGRGTPHVLYAVRVPGSLDRVTDEALLSAIADVAGEQWTLAAGSVTSIPDTEELTHARDTAEPDSGPGTDPSAGDRDAGDLARADGNDVRAGDAADDGGVRAAVELPREPSADDVGAQLRTGAGDGIRPAEQVDPGVRRPRVQRAPNYRLTDSVVEDLQRTHFNERRAIEANLAAIRVLRRIDDEPESFSDEDRATLARYAGWGGLPGVFSPGHHMAASAGEALQTLLTDAEFAEARASTINAHYTAIDVVDGMWEMALQLGFDGGKALEPGSGTGVFIGRVPEAVSASTHFTAVEKDLVSGRILQALYPSARVIVKPYENAPIEDDSVDLVIGNVPFADIRVHDPRYRKLRAPLHDYCIVKSLDKLRPGGVMAVLTSTGTLEKTSNSMRAAMYESSDLVAAMRLPDDAFQGSANTSVCTDLLVFRKRLPDEPAAPFDWAGHASVTGADGELHRINGVFATSRGHLLGHLVRGKSLYSAAEVSTVTRRHPFTGERAPTAAEALRRACASLPKGILSPRPAAEPGMQTNPGGSETFDEVDIEAGTEGRYLEEGGKLCQIIEGRAQPLKVKALDAQRIRAFMPVRDTAVAVLQAQLQGVTDARLTVLQGDLTRAYEGFVRTHGPVNRPVNRRAFGDDPESDLVLALEIYDHETGAAEKAGIFSERTVGPATVVDRCDSAADALLVCVNMEGRVRPERIAALANRPWEECEKELFGRIFKDPDSGQWELAARYKSGHIRRKLRIAEAALEDDPDGPFQANVAALRECLPRALTADEIDVSLGSPWVPPSDIVDFVRHVHDHPSLNVEVRHNPMTADWRVEIPKHQQHFSAPGFSTPRLTAAEIIELSLRGQAPKVMDRVSDDPPTYVLNEVQTALAIEKQKDLQRAFRDWLWSDPARADRLTADYNERFNAFRSPDYSAIPMAVPGMTIAQSLRPIQSTAVARIVLEQSTLVSHPVGFGKTATLAAAAMKLRSLALARKVLGVIPKNVIYQFGAEIKRWFPTARVLMIRSEDLSPKGRARFWRRLQASSADIVLATPEAFKRIELPTDAQVAYFNEEIAQLEMTLAFEEAMGKGGKKTRQVKQLEKMKANFVAKLQRLLNADEKDRNGITLEDMGVDALFIDEAHRYKNLQVFTRERVLGVPTAASQRAFDMASKIRFIQRSGGKVVLATGSAITNTMAEAYNLQRYLQQDELEAAGIAPFDAWKIQFGEIVHSLEPDPAGTGYRTVARLAEVRNVPELVRMLALVTDAVADDPRHVQGRPTPTFETVVSEPTELQQLYREVLAERVREMRADKRAAEDKGDNILVALGDARRASLDMRTLYPGLGVDEAGSKLGDVAAKVAEIYHATAAKRSTQCIFLDLGTPPAGGKPKASLNAYDDLRDRLVGLGIRLDEVAYIHDAKTDSAKADLLNAVRNGTKRVIIGSTEKMGEGSNMQTLLCALHHLNAPPHPGHVTQRNGRIIRQGNENTEVNIFTYVTRGLLEDWAWHLVTLKDRFIRQVMEGIASHSDGDGLARRIMEDASAMDFGAIEAAASDNPLVKEKAQIDAEVKRLEMLAMAHAQARGRTLSQLGAAEERLNTDGAQLAGLEAARALRDTWRDQKVATVEAARAASGATTQDVADLLGDAEPDKRRKTTKETPAAEQFIITINGEPYLERKAAGEALLAAIDEAASRVYHQSVSSIAEIEGLEVTARNSAAGSTVVALRNPETKRELFEVDIAREAITMIRRVESLPRKLDDAIRRHAEWVANAEARIAGYRKELEISGTGDEALHRARADQQRVNIELAEMNAERQTSEDDSSARERFAAALAERGIAASLRSVDAEAKSDRFARPVYDDDDGIRLSTWGGDEEESAGEDTDEAALAIAASSGRMAGQEVPQPPFRDRAVLSA
jgi:N12 class adenine-specific DNA methylase